MLSVNNVIIKFETVLSVTKAGQDKNMFEVSTKKYLSINQTVKRQRMAIYVVL